MRWLAALYLGLRALAITALMGGHTIQAQPADADDAAWARARESGTPEAFQQYLEMFPAGRHVEEAFRGLIEDRVESELGGPHGAGEGPSLY